MIDKSRTNKSRTKATSNGGVQTTTRAATKGGFVVVDGRGGISVDLERMLSSEQGKRSIEKLRKVPIQKELEQELERQRSKKETAAG